MPNSKQKLAKSKQRKRLARQRAQRREELANAKVACLSYPCTGKYKRATWSKVSSWENEDKLAADFDAQLEKGYPKNYDKNPAPAVEVVGKAQVQEDDFPF